MSKWHNYFKATFFAFYTRQALEEWALKELQLAETELIYTVMGSKICWDLICSFISSVLRCESENREVSDELLSVCTALYRRQY